MTLYQLISFIFRLYELIVGLRVLFSWIPVNHYHPVIQWIYRLTEPLLAPIRSMLRTERYGFDFSPIILFLALSLVERLLLRLIFSF